MTDNITNSDFSLLHFVPDVLRARGYRFYLSNGKRLVDLWLNGGAAVLGHTPSNMLNELKNTASRGLYAPYPHFTKNRFLKALSKLFPGRCFRIYAAPPQELSSIFSNDISANLKPNTQNVPVIARLWRPFECPTNPFAADDTTLLVPVLPGIQTWRNGLPLGLCVIAVKSEVNTVHQEKEIQLKTGERFILPESDELSPITYALATRGIYDLLASPERAKPVYPRLNKALKESQWQKKGIYLEFKEKVTLQVWKELFHRFLEAGFLLPPDPSFPLILPGELSDGEEAKLAIQICTEFSD